MNERILKLREESVTTKPYIDTERAELLTEFYKDNLNHKYSTPVFRALAFKHILENKTIGIGEGELIVGERGNSRFKRIRQNLISAELLQKIFSLCGTGLEVGFLFGVR